MAYYIVSRGSRRVKHLRVWAHNKGDRNFGRSVPLCSMDRGRTWEIRTPDEVPHLPICSRCLSEFNELNEAVGDRG